MVRFQEGKLWIKQIIQEMSGVIKVGKGNQRRVMLIHDEMRGTEKVHPSTSITAYFQRFKDVARSNRAKEFDFGNQKRRVRELGYEYKGNDRTQGGGRNKSPPTTGNTSKTTTSIASIQRDRDRGQDGDKLAWKKSRNEESKDDKATDANTPTKAKTHYEPKDAGTTPIGESTKLTTPKGSTNPNKNYLEQRNIPFGDCDGCGKTHQYPRVKTARGLDHRGCLYYVKHHPDYNLEDLPWKESKIGRAYAANKQAHLIPHLCLDKNGKIVEREPGKKRRASEIGASGMTIPYSLKTYILPAILSYRDNTITIKVELDTGNAGKTLIRRDKAMQLVSPDVVRQHEIIYTTANGTPMLSSGSVELDVIIIFDELNNDYEIINNLSFDIVDDLHIPDVDCLISGMDITDNEILVKIPKYHAESIELSGIIINETGYL